MLLGNEFSQPRFAFKPASSDDLSQFVQFDFQDGT
jgi:hypothetical protein